MEKFDILEEGRYHNNFDFFKFPDFEFNHLKYPLLPPLPFAALENAPDIFNSIRSRDHLVHFPFHSYESVVHFFEYAAKDPKVTSHQNYPYRVAQESRIMKALMRAVKEENRSAYSLR